MSISQNFPTISPSLDLSFALTKKLDPRITFSRPTTGAYYDGRTVSKAEENLLDYSQEFSNSVWVKRAGGFQYNTTTAPDGTTTATLMYATTSGTFKDFYYNVAIGSASIRTTSIYAKAAGKSWLWTVNTSGSNAGVWFDLSNGVVGTVEAGCTASITSVGNGWYRCVVVYPSTTNASQWGVSDANNTSSVTANSTDGIFIWGAQLEQRSTVTAYTPTTTQPITNYIPVLLTAPNNVARFDHNPTSQESLGLLIEEQRTNLLTYSEDFSNVAWNKNAVTVESNVLIAPDATLTSDKIVSTTANSLHAIQAYIASQAAPWTFTVYAKAGEYDRILLSPNVTGSVVSFNLTSGTIERASGGAITSTSITHVGNDVYRCSCTSTTTATGTIFWVMPYNANASAVTAIPTWTGDGYSGIYIWGAQLEAGAFPTSYVKTVASQVTRSADSQSGVNLGQIGQGTFYVDATVRSGNALITSGNTTFSATASTRQKTTVAYNATDTRKSINSGTVTSTAGTQGGANITFVSGATGYINKIALYPQKLSDTNLQALTS